MLRTDQLDYELPPELVARRPAEPRDSARLMVCSRSDPSMVKHVRVRDLPGFLRPGDVMTVNASGVLPARLLGRREASGGAVEGLFLAQVAPGRWRVLLKANSKLRAGLRVRLRRPDGDDAEATLTLIERDREAWLVGVEPEGDAPTILARAGATPLPPYILSARRSAGDAPPDDRDRAWYQTVYADERHAGSVAAPTAGLHFTPELLERLGAGGVARASVLLHVGPGTFKPVTADRVEDHDIHSESIFVPPETIGAVESARARGGRSVCVGTTTVRALESLPDPLTDAARREGHRADTDLFILPGFAFRRTDALLTNFHLPRSTLLALVSALLPEGPPRLLELYREAVAEGYRFYSYGDAMLLLP